MRKPQTRRPFLIAAARVSGGAAQADRYEPNTCKVYIRDWCDGPCIVIEGGMNRGIAKAFETAADRHRRIKKVWLWSNGGRTAK
ncbi:MAG: hypothetical protein OXU96_11880 [Gammaproteobacteria bacterium]|nr:hypothetical protein [Gammaproteobacteria bacterium]MDD9874267.1 hypothetical protein [Gammaproteobacteria bacterium]